MESLVSIVKSNIQNEVLLNAPQYEEYRPKEPNCTDLQQKLYELWFFLSKQKETEETFFFAYSEKAELFQASIICVKYKLTRRFKQNIRYMGIPFSKNKDYLYIYIGPNASEIRLNESIIESFFNYNSLHLLYFGNPLKYTKYNKKLLFYKKQIQQHNFDLHDFVIVSSGILGIYGMREPIDIDMVTIEPDYREICDDVIDCHHHVLKTYEIELEELIRNPNKYVYWDGVKFAALSVVYKACNNRIQKTKKLDGYFIRVIWGEESASIFKLTEKRILHYIMRTTREWRKKHPKYSAWETRIVQKVVFCFKIPYLGCRKIYRIVRSRLDEKNKD